ncbi:hypothetical protein LIER_05267 [Lithospermum erythrorhizon]|uniref:Uncharacterized protein n=1 Tax=Lithospermum erythrorhizon TaxID=34254 RepID=A0AAV3P043_LITER
MVTFSEQVDNLKAYLDVIGDSFDGMTSFVIHDPFTVRIVGSGQRISLASGGKLWGVHPSIMLSMLLYIHMTDFLVSSVPFAKIGIPKRTP